MARSPGRPRGLHRSRCGASARDDHRHGAPWHRPLNPFKGITERWGPGSTGTKTTDTEAEALIRNTYKVLLTRGMRGTVLYSTDSETQEFLTGLTSKAG
ncbi:DNA/RNA helicase domain-containing protein [Nocardiopsis codii]|uniref:DNA/RNA helicase domain-containing protein n=1 Tax=Nocardiopsis codii TaxID=3065942 RepID=UPI002E7C283E|nr:DNA/RNA helicase domain-containing protein [Nocardiopsis sp. CT-R113]